ncbi:NUDIX domain-containing protein [Chachezhania antarctica]|uniref:NUDIX domain-containing protein n=1 Tax=Chachezhania antarctica TaxID=2340860 RepID=UPI000EB29816|nr:NUDIX domain-containing protein [Chachezhania antarctica]
MTDPTPVPAMQNASGTFRPAADQGKRVMAFYGTLRHIPVLQTVLGRVPASDTLAEGTMPDHVVYKVAGGDWPMIAHQPGAQATLLLLTDASAEDVARLSDYELGWGYTLERIAVRLNDGQEIEAEMFMPAPEAMVADGLWSLPDWAQTHGEQAEAEAVEFALLHGHMTPEEITARDGIIGVRATARIAAAKRPADPDRRVEDHVEEKWFRRAYANFFALDEISLKVRRYDGTMGDAMERAALWVGDAVVVLPYDPLRDEVLLVEQFRTPVYVLGDPNPWVWEPVAGLIDAGEAPETAARRETQEEAGLELDRLEKVAGAYSSTGSSTEFLHLYIGIADLSNVDSRGGLEEEGEDIRSRVLSFDALMAEFDAGAFKDLPLVTTLLWLARHRDTLRDSA